MMTRTQMQAVELIRQLPDDKIQAVITLLTDEMKLIRLQRPEERGKKKKAFMTLEGLDIGLPGDFDADKELAAALEEKYGPVD